MKRISDFIAEELAAAFEAAGYDRNYAKVTLSNRPDLCEYQCNGAMAGAKAYHKAPIMIGAGCCGKIRRKWLLLRCSGSKSGIYQPEIRRKICSRLSG